MASATADRTLVRRRRQVRVFVLKKRATVASLLGFVALFGLAAQHSVKGAGAKATAASSRRATRQATFFDEGSSGFSFGEGGSVPSQPSPSQVSPPTGPPVAQTSVS